MTKCPRCAKSVHRSVNACLECGADLRPLSRGAWLRLIGLTVAAVAVTVVKIHNYHP